MFRVETVDETPVIQEETSSKGKGTSETPVNAACKVTKNSSPYLLCCNHGVADTKCGDPVNNEVYQDDINANKIGEIHSANSDDDWALIEETSDADINNVFSKEVEGTSKDVIGHASKSYINDLASNNTAVFKTGWTTCETRGTVDGIGSIAWCDTSVENVSMNVESYDGDSGGVGYKYYDDFGLTD